MSDDDSAITFLRLVEGVHVEVILLCIHTAILKITEGIVGGNRSLTDCPKGQVLAGWLSVVFILLVALYRHTLKGYVHGPLGWRVVRLVLFGAVLATTHYRPISCSVGSDNLSIFAFVQGGVAAFLALLGLVFLARRVHWREVFSIEGFRARVSTAVGPDLNAANTAPSPSAQQSSGSVRTSSFVYRPIGETRNDGGAGDRRRESGLASRPPVDRTFTLASIS